ncbi:hypothetical protein M427DRAFT_52545 [Gonapodya prolifera JEL478]|uniref:DUF4139 domain-containing protein n=1 Tax=Gonapodya prolifera (strain JEL478) TaxID=1344416 RepID=A0A139AUS0_GONPJ|nr:hypothetical protein M427DRAFT_52545 [Gonapodya prolifera JEL478]|eukprot:KXS20323.1 hypothetical protein M427DRAFT_52545 [Gonapodya prolifera JEL478]
MTGAAVSSPPAAPGPLHPESLSGLTAYLSLYASSSADLDAQLHSLNKQLRDLDLEIDIVRKNLDEANTAVHSASAEDSALRTVTVLVEAQADVEAELSLSYLVFNAGWSPYYDLRVTSDEQKLRINYKAEIRQYTGEDWLDANVALSTATPALGGDAPTPSRWTISIAPKYVRMTKSATVFKKMAVPSSSRSMQAESVEEDRLAYSSLSAEMMKMAAPVTTVEESLTTATYRVASRTNVPGDNVTHKVTVAIIDLSPKFLHFTYPRASEYVYLKAKVKNDSEYALLPGPASVFLDNNFVAKSTLDNVSPQETFECSLGVDPSIRVTRRPVVKTTETSGILSKSEVLRFTQTIDVKNTKTSSAKVVLIDQVPWSGDEKLKVTLIDPPQPTQVVAGDTPGERRIINRTKSMESLAAVTRDEDIELRDGEVQTRLNTDTNCLEWVVKLAAGKSSVLKFQYSIQYPSGEKVAGIV